MRAAMNAILPQATVKAIPAKLVSPIENINIVDGSRTTSSVTTWTICKQGTELSKAGKRETQVEGECQSHLVGDAVNSG